MKLELFLLSDFRTLTGHHLQGQALMATIPSLGPALTDCLHEGLVVLLGLDLVLAREVHGGGEALSTADPTALLAGLPVWAGVG